MKDLILALSLLLTCIQQASSLDYLTFALQYPPGFCRSTFKNRCLLKNTKQHFTIHGLWPSSVKRDDKTVENCPMYEEFNLNSLAPIRNRLEAVWPSAKTNNPVQFWIHEWKRHGTCGTPIEALKGVFRYFNTTLNLYDKFNLMEFFANNDIVPSTKIAYSIEDLQAALGDDLHSKVNLVCDRAKDFDHPVLTEVRACLNDKLLPIDCPGKKQRCGNNKVYFLPLEGDGRVPAATSEGHGTAVWGLATSFVLMLLSTGLYFHRTRAIL